MNKLVLGTVQFGLNYGINNEAGKTSRIESLSILKEAVDSGMTIFDTAAAYGDAEEVLGEFISSYKLKNKVKIISKLSPNIFDSNSQKPEYVVKEEVKKSLKRLQIDILDGFLLHTPTYFYNRDILNSLKQCREEGLIKHFGVSIYEEEHALDAVNSGLIDYIQVPYNVFDQRLNQTDFFKNAKKNNVKVFARSPFLQGLILMEDDHIPPYLSKIKKYLREFDEIINRHKFSRLEAALLFPYVNSDIDYVVFGINNIDQLREGIEIITEEKIKSFAECKKELKNKFINIEKSIISPVLWGKGVNSF
ncbi:MAG: aldo/keto reductase [Patescibacteria group bacterium]